MEEIFFSHRLPLIYRPTPSKVLTVSMQLFSHPPQRAARAVYFRSRISGRVSMPDRSPVSRERAMRAAPKAPMIPAISGQIASVPAMRSKARSTAWLKKVPPWTTICSPRSRASASLMTLYKAFLMTL